jgi:hypothetical protein
MKVYNLTDVSTASLVQRGFVGRTLIVGPCLLAPGQSAEIDPVHFEPHRTGVQALVTIGALSVGPFPPAAYLVAKSQAAPPAPTPAPQPVPKAAGG